MIQGYYEIKHEVHPLRTHRANIIRFASNSFFSTITRQEVRKLLILHQAFDFIFDTLH